MDLFRDWRQHTEDVNSSLPGWRLFDPNITAEDISNYFDPCFFYSWRGIFCDIVMNQTATAARTDANRQYNTRIVSITVSGASIVGTLPTSIWNIDSLVSLDLSNNQLVGSIPVSLGLNERLRSLNLSNNTLTGNLPWNISGNWTNLVTADFSKNKFTGNMPNLSTVASLHTLNLSHNNFVGPIDISVLNASTKRSLTILDLSNNTFTGPMPNLGECSNIASLSLSYNSFDEGPCPSWLSNLPTLENLGLSGTSLTGELNMSTFSSLKQLKTLELDDNNITGTLNIDSTINNGTLQTIRLRGNQISKVGYVGMARSRLSGTDQQEHCF
ncbi:hypothetical protein M758_1G205900 [Ceratodon purpureus]|nr:hypothetical protein M758_1G205900 [Ceratodon purpureus]